MISSCRRLALGMMGLLLVAGGAQAQRRMEYLGRGTVAVPLTGGVLVHWRITGPEYAGGATYNLYRGTAKIASDLKVSNYTDANSTGEGYSVAAVVDGVEQSRSAAVAPLAKQFFTIPVRAIDGKYDAYEINDASVGDLDGDGEYEIVVKRLSIDDTPAATTYHYLEAYKLDGKFLWAINLGPNLINKVEVNFLVYDLDGDGKAEVATRTSDGFTDGTGKNIGDRDGDGKVSYRATAVLNSSYYRIDGPDYISVFEGATGKELAWGKYIDRDPLLQWGTSGMSESQLSHRAEKCMWSVAYLDGVNPSFVISRGIYHRIKLEAWKFRGGALTKEWAFDTDPNGVASAYTGSGYHNFIVGDVDGDGKDETMYGSMGVDEAGKGMYSTGFGHGDAQHLADINPDIKGLEHFACLEGANGSTIPGLSLRNATTGAIQWKLTADGDIGRCLTADIDENHKGYEMWGSANSSIYSSTGTVISTTQPTTAGGGATYNFGIWWDGDLMRELLDRTVITKWNATNKATDRVATLYNIASIVANNGTKSNPSLMADVLGDWREEAIFPLADQTGLVVFVTPFPTAQRMYTLMHDPNYRTAISWQQNSYNQPPNLGFYFGVGMATPTAPNITVIGGTTGVQAGSAKATAFGLRRVGDQLRYSAVGGDAKLRLRRVDGSQGVVWALPAGEGAVDLSSLARGGGLWVATLERGGVVARELVMR
jgi:rhamnogalacturonan endolyase